MKKTLKEQGISKAKTLEVFLKFIDECESEYSLAFELVGKEDRRLQDLVHEMEFAPDKLARNRIATKLHHSRVQRRENKDIVQLNEEIVKFFGEKQNRETINRMRQLLGQQRKKEEYLNSERHYNKREDDFEIGTPVIAIKPKQKELTKISN